MNAEIISVGTELLLGDILNSNSQFLSRELAAYGIDILYQSTVGDNKERLGQTLKTALLRSDMVILTGGLGPTEDDVTREVTAQVLDLPLELHEESLGRIQEYFASTGKEYTENNRKQAMLPQGCLVLPNDRGTAPGCVIESGDKKVVLLPGPPYELTLMFTEYVAPYLSQCSGGTIHSHTIGVFGIAESAIGERLQDLMSNDNPTVAPYAKEGEIIIRITAKAATKEEADTLCEPIITEICDRLGNAVYGVDAGNLPKRVVTLLGEKNMKIATAESCTAGVLSGKLTEVSGASRVFECGVAAYSKEIKHQMLGVSEEILEQKGAVSPETASAMAMGVRLRGGADIGVGITGVAGPDTSEGKAVGTVYVALADEKRVWVKKILAGHGEEDREHIRHVATSYALDMTRRYLEALPGVMAGGQLWEQLSPVERTVKPADFTVKQRRTLWLRWSSLLLVLLIAATFFFYYYWYTPYRNQKKFDELWDKYKNEVPVNSSNVVYPQGMLTQFMSLYQSNDDVRGWITVEGMSINYPVMEEPSLGYYKSHDFYGKASTYGVPYVEGGIQWQEGMMPQTITIFGNNSNNGQMFSALENYTEIAFLREHPSFTMSTLYQESGYKIFAVMLVDDTDEQEFDYDKMTFENDEDFINHVMQIRMRSLFDTPVDVVEGDRLLLLTTPIDYGYNGARIVVVARKVRASEDAKNDLSKARVNRSVKMPKGWLEKENITQITPTTTGSTVTEETTAETTIESTTTEPSKTTTTTKKPTPTTEKMTTDKTAVTTITESTAVTTTTTVATTTKPTTPSHVTGPVEGTVAGSIPEQQFMELFAVRNTGVVDSALADCTVGGVIRPKTKEQLQRVLTHVVKVELGTASSMVNSTEAQKAQAVAAYTYILNHCADGKVYDYAFEPLNLSNKTDKKIYDAVGEVTGVKLLDLSKTEISDMPCFTPYFSSTGGYTASSNRVWTGYLPYNQSVVSKYDDANTYAKYRGPGNFVSQVTLTRDDLYTKIQQWVATKYEGSTMPAEQFTTDNDVVPLRALSYDGDGTAGKGDAWNYVYQTNFYYLDAKGKKKVLTGNQIRSIIGNTIMRSHAFRTEFDAATQMVTITTQGYGHGVGLSQMGAVGYANEEGWTYVQILRHYYSVTDKTAYQVVLPKW
ncbi:MAG: competence/damage-inducible protein A [Clostridia bacterium]|nr:competence/damage-inducible protein A [Clostridia bacterium]